MPSAKRSRETSARRQELRRQGLQQLREAVWQMREVKDIEQVLSTIGTILSTRKISFIAYSINLVEALEGELPIQVYIHDPDGRQFLAALSRDQAPARIILESWKTKKTLYRADLTKENIYGEHLQPQPQHDPVRCALDVPFSRGTLALASGQPGAYSAEEISFLQEVAQVLEEGFLRLEDLRALQQALRREEAMGRVRSRIIAMRHLSELGGELEKAWVEELRNLGIPVNRVSLQRPAAEEGLFLTYSANFMTNAKPGIVRLADCPWVEEAWESGKPVAVDRRGLDQARFNPEVQSLLEVPLPGEGSIGLNSLRRDAFGPEAVRTVQTFAGLIAEGLQRLRDFEALSQAEQNLKLDVALQRVRNEILLMRGVEDWRKVVVTFEQELREVIKFKDCGINILDRQHHRYLDYETDAKTVIEKKYDTLPLALTRALDTGEPVYRRNRAEIDQFEDPIKEGTNCVLDVPFAGGTVAINSSEENAFSPRDIQTLERFAPVLNEAHRRLEDLRALALHEEQLHQVQKLEAVGQLATGVAHEINNPLTSVLGYSELLLRRELDPEMRGFVETIHQEGERAREIAARLVQFVRRQKSSRQSLSLNLIVQEVLTLSRQQFELDHVRLSAELSEGLPQLNLYPGQVQQLLLALLQNSREAIQKTGKAGEVKVQTRQQGAWVRLIVEDDGPGIPEQVRERIFEPFFTTKEVGKGAGTGLGLSFCFSITREHGGRLWAEPRTAGAGMVLELPIGAGAGESTAKEVMQNAG